MRKKTFLLLIALAIVFSMTMSISAYAASNPYPKSQDLDDINGDGYPDGDGYYEIPCTWFCWQQVYETLGIELPGWGNAITWDDYASGIYEIGTTPRLHSIAVWNNTLYGHVAFVTSVDGDNFLVNEGGRTDLDQTDSHGVAYAQFKRNASYINFIYLEPTNREPIGNFDGIESGNGTIRVTGWAYDPDCPDVSISIHAYVGGNSASGEGHNLGLTTAYREDVNKAFGISGNHGFDFTFQTKLTGNQPVYLYAIDSAGGNNPEIGSKSVVINNVKTYTVSYDANGGTDAPESQTKTQGVDLKLSDKVPTRDGYSFVEWSTEISKTEEGEWSAWQTTPVTASATKQVETRQVPISYNMESYLVTTSDAYFNRGWYSYLPDSAKANPVLIRAEYHITWPADVFNAAGQVTEGSNHDFGGCSGTNRGSGTAYYCARGAGEDGVLLFVKSVNTETQYRYRDIKTVSAKETYKPGDTYKRDASATLTAVWEKSVIASGECGEKLTWTLDDNGTLTISGTGAMYDYAAGSSVYVEPSGWTIPRTTAPWGECCESIKRLVINTGVTGIGNYAFFDCANLAEININSNITSIGKYAFTYSAAKSIQLPDSIVSIGAGAFQDCRNLTDINIPVGLTEIEDSVFAMCSSLESIVVPEGVTSIGSSAFFGTNLQTFHFPASLTDKWSLPGTIKAITVSKDNKYYSAIGGVLFNKAKDTLIWFPGGKSSECTEYTIPSSVTRIETNAFIDCKGLKRVVILDNVKYIGGGAFAYCSSLKSIEIHAGVISMDSNPFYGCSSLTDIYISPGNNYYCVEDCIIYNKDKTEIISFPSWKNGKYTTPDGIEKIGDLAFANGQLSEVIISEGVTIIGNSAFSGNPLISAAIPKSVTEIGDFAFNFYNLKDVYYNGTEGQWNAIKIGSNNIGLDRAAIHFERTAVLTLPASLKKIETETFMGVTAEVIIVPEGVTEIGSRAFANCPNLRQVIFHVDPDTISIAADYLEGCKGVEIVRP